MKKQEEAFDCVKMKWEIQEKIAKEFKGMPQEKARKIQDERVAKNPILGPFLKKVRELQAQQYRTAD
jgi:hypothetical protein